MELLAEKGDGRLASGISRLVKGSCVGFCVTLPKWLVKQGLPCRIRPGIRPGIRPLWTQKSGFGAQMTQRSRTRAVSEVRSPAAASAGQRGSDWQCGAEAATRIRGSQRTSRTATGFARACAWKSSDSLKSLPTADLTRGPMACAASAASAACAAFRASGGQDPNWTPKVFKQLD